MSQVIMPDPSEDPSEPDAPAVSEPVEPAAKDSVFQRSVRVDSSGRVLHEWEVDPA